MATRKLLFLSFLTQFISFLAFSQEIITAERYLEMVSEKYANMRDFEAGITIQTNGSTMTGTVSYLVPFFLRIDFTTPAEQVIVFNGDTLTLYLPDYRATLTQEVSSGRSSASGQGLRILRRNYTPSYVTGPAPVLLEGTAESVVKLRLTRRSGSESFREIIVSVNPDTKLIRRMDGVTLAGGLVRFDFAAIKINQGVPEQRFTYDSPASSNMYKNFLFRDTD
ncbi:MAG: outer membrane lipoprotein carrier protein LolA [Treponema sp.]|jgi:outer membrane lipoprotein-sorting protein|nr:outer membrane lipoprotein carrier protein LolA [Treponema sp.]